MLFFLKNKGPLLNESLLDRLTPPPTYYAGINKTHCQRCSAPRIKLGSYWEKHLHDRPYKVSITCFFVVVGAFFASASCYLLFLLMFPDG